MHSIKPSIESTGFTGMAGMGSKNYYNYLENSIIQNRTQKYWKSRLTRLGTSYIIFHNDTWDKRENTFDSSKAHLLRKLYAIDDLTNIHNVGLYNVFKVDHKRILTVWYFKRQNRFSWRTQHPKFFR